MSKINGVKKACCTMDGMKFMFNERWSGSMNYLYMVKKIKSKLNMKFLWEKKQARYIYFFCSMCPMREHLVHVFIIHSPNIVNALVLFAHLLIIMNIFNRLPITVNIAVLYYSAILCSICTAESNRNIKSFSNIFSPQKVFFSQMFNSTNRRIQFFFRYRNFCNAFLQKLFIIICPEIVSNR